MVRNRWRSLIGGGDGRLEVKNVQRCDFDFDIDVSRGEEGVCTASYAAPQSVELERKGETK